jgi:hypothetical protein
MKFKSDWSQAREHHIRWWQRKGPVLKIVCPRATPVEAIPEPAKPADLLGTWTDPTYRVGLAEQQMAGTMFLADAFPYFDGYIGPGTTNILLGSQPHFAEETVWYEPCIADPDTAPPIGFEPSGNHWWGVQMALLEEAHRRNAGRYLLGVPDLVENLDVLAALRDTEKLLMDLAERPEWVAAKVWEINEAYFAIFDRIYDLVKDEHGGHAYCAFNIYGPGKTAKVQCDISCMMSPRMFKDIVVPPLAAQCKYLDCSMYHLDGEDALGHLDALLAIDDLDAIEWTPVGASGKVSGMPTAGSPSFYDLYRRILKAGKCVQAIQVRPEDVIPLLDAVGPNGLYVDVIGTDEKTATQLVEKTRQYY